MLLLQPIIGLVVHGDIAELRELEDQICRAGLLAFSQGVLGSPMVLSAGSGTIEGPIAAGNCLAAFRKMRTAESSHFSWLNVENDERHVLKKMTIYSGEVC